MRYGLLCASGKSERRVHSKRLARADMSSTSFDWEDRRESRRWKDPVEKALRAEDVVLKHSTSSENKTADAIRLLGEALAKCGIENEIASYMKRKFDELHGSFWQCIVGRNFGSHLDCVEYIHLTISKISVLVFRCR